MPEENTNPEPVKKTRKTRTASTKPRAPRKPKDPGIVAIEREAAAKKEAYRNAQRSAGILKTIIEKRLGQLTGDDQQKLYDELGKRVTPTLPMDQAPVKTITCTFDQIPIPIGEKPANPPAAEPTGTPSEQ